MIGCAREEKERKRKEKRETGCAVRERGAFWKMVYKKLIFCKPFSEFLAYIFRSTENNFRLTNILQANKHT
jgi:hypothetical protein